jgi:GTP-binding protein Era
MRTFRERAMPVPSREKRLDIVILGAPNAGKSVLLNSVLNTKLSAATKKKHTTRQEILGVFNHRNTQLAFIDTPGFVQANDTHKARTRELSDIAINSVASKADVVLLVVDAARVNSDSLSHFAEMAALALKHAKMEVILVLNKVDMVEPKTRLLETTRRLVSIMNGIRLSPQEAHLAELDTTTFMVSAKRNDGLVDLVNYLISVARFDEWVLPKDEGITSLSDEVLMTNLSVAK